MRRPGLMPRVSCLLCRVEGPTGGMAAHFKSCGTDKPRLDFWAKVDKSAGQDACWLYMGFRKWDGYGWVSRFGKNMTAHRYAWILTHGPVPEGLHVLHQCDNPPCCNPDHMRLGTHAENMAEMKERGRANAGHFTKRKPTLFPDRVRPARRES